MACCPFHNEKTPSFTVSPEKQFYHCFGCGAHGTALGFLMDYERLEFLEAVEVLAQRAGLEIPRDANAPPPQSHHRLLALLEKAHAHFRSCLRAEPVATRYLKNRGLSGEVAARFGLGFAPDRFDSLLNALQGEASEAELLRSGLVKKNVRGKLYDCFRNRIMFAIRDRRGRVIGFGGRVMDDAVPKYINSPETPVFHKGDVLYGMYEARKAKGAPRNLVVVEGYMDVLALAQHGIENTVATLGTATTSQHVQQLFRYTQEIIFCFDGDRAGREAAWRAAEHTLPVFRDGLEAKVPVPAARRGPGQPDTCPRQGDLPAVRARQHPAVRVHPGQAEPRFGRSHPGRQGPPCPTGKAIAVQASRRRVQKTRLRGTGKKESVHRCTTPLSSRRQQAPIGSGWPMP